MTMAYWNGMTWGVSNKEIAFLESLTTVFAIETETNADKEGKSSTETVAPSLIEFAMNTTYRVETGTKDIRGKIEEWKSLVGKSAPLLIGGSVFGPDKVRLESVGVANLEIDARGTMRAVNLAFKFKEIPTPASGTTTTTKTAATTATATAATSKGNETAQTSPNKDVYKINNLKGEQYAVFLQPSEQVKKELKTLSMVSTDGGSTVHMSSAGVMHGGSSSSFGTSSGGRRR